MELFNGTESGGRATFNFLGRFRDAMTENHRDIIFGDEQLVSTTQQDRRLTQLGVLIDAHTDAVLEPDAQITPEARKLHKIRVQTRKEIRESLAIIKTRRDEMKDAADKGLEWIRANSGTVIATMVTSYDWKENRLVQLRCVIRKIQKTCGGEPQAARDKIDADFNKLLAARTKKTLLTNLNEMIRLHEEQKKHFNAHTAEAEAEELEAPWAEMKLVKMFKRKVSKEPLDEVSQVRAWLDEKREVGNAITWEILNEYIVFVCQQTQEVDEMEPLPEGGQHHKVSRAAVCLEDEVEVRAKHVLQRAGAATGIDGAEIGVGGGEPIKKASRQDREPGSLMGKCFEWERYGTCKFNDKCWYQHGPEDSRPSAKKARREHGSA